MFELKNTYEVLIDGIPVQWIPKIEIYYPDLPQFPIMYIHTYCGNERIIGCPVCVSYDLNGDKATAKFTVLSNLPYSDEHYNCLKKEIEDRIGFSKKISLDTVSGCCEGEEKYINLFTDLWKYIKSSYGDTIPYGRFYEEVYSIPRFVAAWQPKTGRQSEMRMLYNFMSAFGNEVSFPSEWSHLEYYVIPNYIDAINENYSEFETFSKLYSAMKKVFNNQFSNEVEIEGVTFKVQPKAWKQNKDDFIKYVSQPLFEESIITSEEKLLIEILVDAFNRHAWRAAYFISAFVNITNSDYRMWSKDFFSTLYDNGGKLKGYSEKVMACFLQQGFCKEEIIPIDTWIETFFNYPLGIENRTDFYNEFSGLGKLERVIWLASQSNKTNMRDFFDILWCQRYGTIGNTQLRGVNPTACYGCKLKNSCVGLSKKASQHVLLWDINDELPEDVAEISPCDFICVTENGIPKKTYSIQRGKLVLVDEFSGYIFDEKDKLPDTLIQKKKITVNEFVTSK